MPELDVIQFNLMKWFGLYPCYAVTFSTALGPSGGLRTRWPQRPLWIHLRILFNQTKPITNGCRAQFELHYLFDMHWFGYNVCKVGGPVLDNGPTCQQHVRWLSWHEGRQIPGYPRKPPWNGLQNTRLRENKAISTTTFQIISRIRTLNVKSLHIHADWYTIRW